MSKTNFEKCRQYRQKKNENKIRKDAKRSTERVREFRARRKALLNVQQNIFIAHDNTSTVQNSEHDHCSIDTTWNEGRLCDYDGKYYCTRCHWNTAVPTPARIIHNWDLEPRRVCQACAQLLRLTSKRPNLPVALLNPRLFGLVHELSLVQKQRDQLILMKRYLIHCRLATEHHLLSTLGEYVHMADGAVSSETVESAVSTSGVHMYSVQDLVDTDNGTLPKVLQDIMDVFVRHIKVDCMVCRGRGHLCELCGNNDILYPFDEGAITCQKCGGVYHRACWTVKRRRCTKCERRDRRKETELEEHICDIFCENSCKCSTKILRDTNKTTC